MTAHIEKTVFISYRRTNFYTALAVYQDLTQHGYDVFFDFQSIDSGDFEKAITENIKAKAHFLIILSSSALERCKEPGDWLRREIEIAMDEKRNIVPLMMEGFDFGSPSVKEALSGKLASLNRYNGLRLVADYFFEAMEKLRRRYLNVAVEAISLHPVSTETEHINEMHKVSANEAAQVETIQLSAEEWFERGYILAEGKNTDEAIRCFSEAIRLDPKDIYSYVNRGSAKLDMNDATGAIEDYNEVIQRLDPKFTDAYIGRGTARYQKGDIDGAIEDYTAAIHVKRGNANAYMLRAITREKKDDTNGAIKDYTKVIHLKPEYAEAYSLRGDLRRAKKDLKGALADYNEVIRLKPDDANIHYIRGSILSLQGDNQNALYDLQKASKLKPKDGAIRIELVRVLKSLGLRKKAKEQEKIARELIQRENEYNQACLEAICRNTDKALELLKIGLENKQATKEWARQDSDFENIRDDPRFKELVGE